MCWPSHRFESGGSCFPCPCPAVRGRGPPPFHPPPAGSRGFVLPCADSSAPIPFPVVSPKTISSPMARIIGSRSGSSPAPPDPANRSCRGNSPAQKMLRLPASCRPAGFGLLELGFTPRRNGRGPSLCSTRRQSPGRISFLRPSNHRLPPGRAEWNWNQRRGPRGCRSI